MAKLEVLGLSLALALMLPGPYAGAADEIRGKVISITLTDDCSPQGQCDADVVLATEGGKTIAFHVPPDIEIMRGGKVILLSQLGIGSVIRVPDYDEVSVTVHTPKRIWVSP